MRFKERDIIGFHVDVFLIHSIEGRNYVCITSNDVRRIYSDFLDRMCELVVDGSEFHSMDEARKTFEIIKQLGHKGRSYRVGTWTPTGSK